MESTENVAEHFLIGGNTLRKLLKSSRLLEILSRNVVRKMLQVSL